MQDHAPLEHAIVLHKLIEVRHKLINSFTHMHMPDVRPHSIRIAQRRDFILGRASAGLELVPDYGMSSRVEVTEECGEGCEEWCDVVLHSGICVELDAVSPVTGRPRCAKPELSKIHPKDNVPNTV